MTETHKTTDQNQLRKKRLLNDDIAIIGIGCRFPGAKDYDQFWENLDNGVNSIKTITPDRWDIEKFYSANFNEPNKSQSKWCGLVQDVDQFDNRFFNISPREAKNMDPQQRLLLEETWHCIEDSGVMLNTLQEKITSVYIGVMATDYLQMITYPNVTIDGYAALGNYPSILANRLSYTFGFQGQSISINAACASSLVAIHQARRSLLNAACDYAIAGGVSLNLHPWKYISFSKARMLSPEGQCKTFDAGADGYVPGEGVGMILMQPLADAKEQGNHIYGIIKGSAVNHCGKTLSITAPLVEAQKKVILSAYKEAAIHPDTVTYTEAHGTGTSLGDPIEIESLTKAFAVHTEKKGFCKIGSVKTNIGHLEAAAGVAGVIKVLMMMKNRIVPKTLNVKQVNPIIRFKESPFILAHTSSPWRSSKKRFPLRAGVSSFGMGGVNSHILLEEHAIRQLKLKDDPQRPHLFVLSAKESRSLDKLISAWETFVKSEMFSGYRLQDICAVLSAGRKTFSHRFGVLIENKADLKKLLSGKTKPAVIMSLNNWCLRIGAFSFQGFDDFRKLETLNVLFKQKLNSIKTEMKKLGLPKTTIYGFSKKKWPAAKIPLYSFMAGYAFIRVILDSGFKPHSITGEKNGFWIALVLSGAADLSSVLAFLAGKRRITQIKLQRPNIPFWDPENETTYMPFQFYADDVRTMIKAVTPSKDNPWLDEHMGAMLVQMDVMTQTQLDDALAALAASDDSLMTLIVKKEYCTKDVIKSYQYQIDIVRIYVKQARSLVHRQFTFKKFLKEWDTALAPTGNSVLRMLEDDNLLTENKEGQIRIRLLLLIIIFNALHRLNKKWHLTEPRIITHKPFHEFLAFFDTNVMPKKILVDLLISKKPDYDAAAKILNQRQVHLNLDHGFGSIKIGATFTEISDISTWMKKRSAQPFSPTFSEKTAYWEIGKFSQNAPAQISIQTEMRSDLATRFCESLLQLWMQGFDMQLGRIYPAGTFNKVSLPVYPFVGRSFWLPPRKTGPEIPVQESDASLPKIASQYVCSRTDPIIDDHVITGKNIIPAAYMLSLVAASVEKTGPKPVRRFHHVIFHNPGIVENSLKIESKIETRQFSLVTKAAKLCTGEYTTSVESNPKFAPFNFSSMKTGSCDEIYQRLYQAGYQYGKGLQVLKKSWTDPDRNAFEIVGPIKENDESSYLDPAVLDGVFQSMLAAAIFEGLFTERDYLYIPYMAKTFDIYSPVVGPCLVSISQNDINQKGQDLIAGAMVYNRHGNCIAQIKDMLFKRVALDFLIRVRSSFPKTDAEVERQTTAVLPETDTVRTAIEHVYCYKPDWLKQAPLRPAEQVTPRQAIVFSNNNSFTDKLGRQLEDAYQHISFIQKSEVLDQGYLRALKTRIAKSKDTPVDIYWLLGFAPEARVVSSLDALAGIQDEVIIGLSQLAVDLARLKRSANILIPTMNAFVIQPEDSGRGYAVGGLSGLARTIMIEHPGIGIKIVDFSEDDAHNIRDLIAEALCFDQVDVVGYRHKNRYLRTIKSISLDTSLNATVWKDGGVYLLIGGFGGLGMKIAREISLNLKVKLVICGRSQLDPQKQKIIENLSGLGSEVIYSQTDVTNQKQVRNLIKTIKDRFGALNGVIHSGGVLDDKLLVSKERESFQKVMASKVLGAWTVNQVTRDEDLDFFAVFSSIVALVGNIGQADYAAANSFLDAFMHFRAQNKFPGRSISLNWTLWLDGGMGGDHQTRKNFKDRGLDPILSRVGVAVLHQILQYPELPQVVVSGGKVTEFANSKDERENIEVLAGKTSEKTHDPSKLDEYVLDLIARKIDTTASQIDKDESFFALGVESVALLDIMAELDKKYDHLSPTLLFEYPNTRELVEFLKDQPLKGRTDASSPDQKIPGPDSDAIEHIASKIVNSPWSEEPPQASIGKETGPTSFPLVKPTANSRDNGYEIAIIGMSGRFPESPDIETYWQNLLAGKDCIKEIPRQRWDHMTYFNSDPKHPHSAYGKWGGFIEDVDKFDALFFNISPREAEQMDPQQRLLLECTWHTMENAGYGAKKLWKDKSVGLYVGTMWNEYSQISTSQGFMHDRYVGPGSIYWAIANRVSYFMGFTGPSLAIDTACSSSLTALHLACQGILNNECDMAVAGGVNLSTHPEKYIYLSQAKFLSTDGRCRSFGKDGDGYVPGEGVGTVLLKPLKQAIRDKDHILGICRGSSINHGGKATGFTVPNPEAHTRLILDAMQTANVSPVEIGYVECHGTGTSLGDPIEIRGLTKAFNQKEVKPQCCPIGSVKSNIGHLEAAAGIASVIKVLLCMQHNTIPKSMHSKELNPAIDFSQTPFFVARQNTDWPRQSNHARLASVSSFGAGGANAHAIIQAFDLDASSAKYTQKDGPVLFVLSAGNRHRLEVYAGKWADFLKANSDLNLNDVAYNLQTGRQAMAERLAMVSADRSQLIQGLRDFSVGRFKNSGIFTGNVKSDQVKSDYLLDGEEGREFIKTVVDRKKFDKIGQLWAGGANIDWQRLHNGNAVRKMPLPGYPFERQRFWIPEVEPKTVTRPAAAANDAIHPLLHQNTSDFSEQRFSSDFSGREFFLSDHVVAGQKMLSGAAQLEMANVAVHRSTGISDTKKVQLENITWIRPFVVTEQPAQIHVRLFVQDHQQIGYEIYSGPQTPDGDQTIHSHGSAKLISEQPAVSMDIEDLEKTCRRKGLSAEQYYQRFEKMGLQYGASHRGLQRIQLGDGQALIKLTLPACAEDVSRYGLHPSLIDCAFQGTLALLLDAESKEKDTPEPVLPFALDEVQIFGSCSSEMWARVRVVTKFDKADRVKKFDIDLADASGKIQVRLNGFTIRTPGSAKNTTAAMDTRPGIDLLMLKPQWSPKPADPSIEPLKYIRHEMVLCEPPVELEKHIRTYFKDASIHSYQSDTAAIDKRYQIYAEKCFKWVRNILKGRPKGKVLAQVVVPTKMEKQLFSGLSGLLKTAGLENPNFIGQTILVDSKSDDARIDFSALADQLAQDKRHAEDPLILYRNGKRWVRELIEDRASIQLPWKEKGVYLITGGAGGLGLIFADEIVKQTQQATLILTGRSELDPARQKQIDTLSPSAANISYYRVDVTNEEEVSQLLEKIGQRYARLDGIIHSAGIVRDNYIIKKRSEEFEQVLLPKVSGLVNLDNASRDFDLDFLVMFSSVSGDFGNLGQCDYAAANGFMDAYAVYRNQLVSENKRRGHTVSINWPLWKKGGMHVDAVSEKMLHQSMGIVAMSTKSGVRAFYQAMTFGTDQVIVMEGELERMKQRLGLKTPSDLPSKALSDSAPQDRRPTGDEWIAKTSRYLKALLSNVIKLAPEQIDASAPMEQYGIDSVMVTQLTDELEKHFGSLPKTLFFEYQTIEQLTAYFIDTFSDKLAQLLGADEKPKPSHKEPPALTAPEPIAGRGVRRRFASLRLEAQAEQETDIAVIGLAGRYPHALSLRDFWENLKNGKDCVEEIPAERWDHKLYYDQDKQAPGKTYSKWGGFIQGVDWFDPLFFNISPREALLMDPQERLFLQCVHETLEDAGYTRQAFGSGNGMEPGPNVGVYVGVMYSEYQLYGSQETLSGNPMALNGNPAAIPNRVSYFCNFNGPSMAVDTMCSSSMTAIHLACQSLIRGHCKLAIAGGVNISIHPNKYLLLAQGKFLSSNGRCETFGVGGEGYVPGEGVGSVLLKPLSAAVADNDHIYGIIKGSAINHGGKTNGFTVPNPNAQANVIGMALKEAGVDPRTISYIEAHGTGTSLGDPIEITGLNKAFEEYGVKDKHFCAIGSVKSNIGHCESAAGIAGLTKILLQMKYRQLVPSLHSKVLNAHIDFDNSPFVVQQSLTEWKPQHTETNGQKKKGSRVAGISAFGAGGANAHLIVEEYTQVHGDRDTASLSVNGQNPVIVVLSAKTKPQLRTQAEQLVSFIQSESLTDQHLMDLAFTLQMGREALDQRLALIVTSMAELSQKLHAFVEDRSNIEGLHKGQAKGQQAKQIIELFKTDDDFQLTLDSWIAKAKYKKLVGLWIKGLEFEWRKLYSNRNPRRISLPTYPFARESYFITEDRHLNLIGDNAGSKARLHPVVHRNVSTLKVEKFETDFQGTEFFVQDHVIDGQKLLAGVVCLEMARAAGSMAAEDRIIGIRNVVWSRPVSVNSRRVKVSIEIIPNRDTLDYVIRNNNGEKHIEYARGTLLVESNVEDGSLTGNTDIQAIRNRCDRVISGQECYKRFHSMGMKYGVRFQPIRELAVNQTQALALLELPKECANEFEDYVIHPILADGALQSVLGLLSSTVAKNSGPYLPFSLEEVQIVADLTRKCYAFAEIITQKGDLFKFDIRLTDTDGRMLIKMKGLGVRVIDSVKVDKLAKPSSVIVSDTDSLSENMKKYLKELISKESHLAVEKIGSHENFDKYGIGSVMALSITNQLKTHFGELSNTLFFEYISVAEMADYFAQQHTDSLRKLLNRPEQAKTKEVKVRELSSKEKPKKHIDFSELRLGLPKTIKSQIGTRPDIKEIAIIGISGRYPMAGNVAAFWQNLKQGCNCITPIPEERWNHSLYFEPEELKSGESFVQSGGFINDVDKFDPLFFDISPKEAETIDPQERLFMEIAWEVMEEAGYTREALKSEYNRKIGVFVGCMYQHYPWLARDCQYDGVVNHNSYWSIANRVSYILDSQGPSIAVDSACSSSLSAINLACESIKKGECKMALAGGVNLNLHPDKFMVLSQNQLLASDGKCRALGNGDGYLPGEGVGAVLLKPLPLAEKDRDHIYAVIKGGMMNHGGKTSGYMVPNPKAQSDLMVQVFDSAGVHPETVNYLEIAANGSSLGDAIEITGIKNAFKQFTDKKHFCAIGTVKSNIGHLEAASGISQLTKLICQLQNKTLAPSIHTEPANENIDLAESPFVIQKELTHWDKPKIEKNGREQTYPRTAAISSFGAGGANTTILVQEYENCRQITADPTPRPAVVPLSARTDRQLSKYVAKLSTFLEKLNDSASLDKLNNPIDHCNLAYTFQTGREPMKARLAFVVNSLEELRIKLKKIHIDPTSNIDGVFRSRGMKKPESLASELATVPSDSNIPNMIKNGEFEKIARAWVEGQNIDWRLLPQNADSYKISLPTYAFERRRCWVTPQGQPLGPPEQAAVTGGILDKKSRIVTSMESKPVTAPYTEDQVATCVRKELADFWGLADDDVKPDTPLDRFGSDSIKAINFRFRLEKKLVVSIPMTVIGKSRTLDQLVDNLMKVIQAKVVATEDNETSKLMQTFLQDRIDLSSISDLDLDKLYKKVSSN